MEKTAEIAGPGSKQLNLKKSFRHSVRSLLTAVSFEDFSKAFPKFTGSEQERLYQLYVQIIASLHENMQDEFDSLCHETQVGTILDTVENLIEKQSLDPLDSQESNLDHVKQDLQKTKNDEIRLLQESLDKVEDHKRSIKARIKLLRKTREETSGTTNAVEKLRSMILKYGSYGGGSRDT